MTANEGYLSSNYLDRVRAAYRLALTCIPAGSMGRMWGQIDGSRSGPHSTLMDGSNAALREMFSDPDQLFYLRGTREMHKRLSTYQAQTSLELLHQCKLQSIIEIGPGFGRTAGSLFEAGITDYSTVDLPLGMVAQACFLGRTLGPESVWFYGEPDRPGLRLYPASHQPDRRFGLAINSDSLTEMSMLTAVRYLNWIAEHCEGFFSINQEFNLFTVRDIAARRFTCKLLGTFPQQCDYAVEYFTPRQRAVATPWHKIGWHYLSTRVSWITKRIRRTIN